MEFLYEILLIDKPIRPNVYDAYEVISRYLPAL